MKYLFFDIECSNCFNGVGKMCEFGYVITDEKFNIISRHDIPMNPGRGDTKFDNKIRERDPDFGWAYEVDYYISCPEFPEYYERLRRMFEAEDTMVFGYAVDNDIRYLDAALKRYKKPSFKYDAYDIQIMMRYYSEKRQKFTSLDNAFKSMYGNNEYLKLRAHLSQDDAYMTMMVLKGMCESLEVTLQELLTLCPNSKYKTDEYLNQYYQKRKERKKHPELYQKRTHRKRSEGQVLWGELYKEHLPLLEDINSIGKFITVSGVMKEHLEEFKQLVQLIKDKGYVAYDKINGSDYLIVFDEANKNEMISRFQHPYAGKVLTFDEFLKYNQ